MNDLIDYVARYGGFCRDCADNDGSCPLSAMPCDRKQQVAVIKHTINALKYGIEHGFIENPFKPSSVIKLEWILFNKEKSIWIAQSPTGLQTIFAKSGEEAQEKFEASILLCIKKEKE